MKRVARILLWSLFILHEATVCSAQNSEEEMTRPLAELSASPFRMTWPGVSVDGPMAPVGLIDRLATDGTWARYQKEDGFVTVSCVGKITVDGQSCRWIEVALEEGGPDQIWKLLIQEERLKDGQNILAQGLSVWHCTGPEEPLNVTGISPPDEFSPLTFILTGPDQEIRSLAPQAVETKLGRLECAGWTGRQLTRFDEREIDATYRQWVHEKAPFGVLRSEIEHSIKFDGRLIQAKTSVTLVDVGTDAHSRISTASRSVEEITARPFAPASGWRWAVLPDRLGWASMATRGLAMVVDRNEQEFRLTLAYPWTPGGPEYRPVAFDAAQHRYEFGAKHGGASGTVGLAIFALAQKVLPANQIKRVGIEKLRQDVWNEPPALVGKSLPLFSDMRFNFIPKSVGKKAILMCFFDLNQRPSRQAVTELRKTAQQLSEKDLIIVAVQVSKIDENTLSKWVKENSIPFPVGMVRGNEEKIRFAWGVQSLPWLILTDLEHIVRAEGFGLSELDAKTQETVPSANAPVDSGEVTGLVKDPSGQVLSDVRVTEFQTDREYVTNADGKFVSAFGPSDTRRFFFAVHKQRKLVGVGQLPAGQR